MAVISYAQNGEDVVLARALAGVVRGTYVDVGANDPTVDSVTRHFYDLGWSGINIEPQPHRFEQLMAARPRDTNVQVGAGRVHGSLTFHRVPEIDGWSTFDEETARRVAESGHRVEPSVVPVVPLVEIVSAHISSHVGPGGGPVDFLKVDVEGFEDEVLGGVDWSVFRPRLLVVESGEAVSVWEQRAVGHGYRRTLWDGVNVFLVRSEDDDALGPLLRAPASAKDEFEMWRYLGHIRNQANEIHSLRGRLRLAEAALLWNRSAVLWGAELREPVVGAGFEALIEVFVDRDDLHAVLGSANDVDLLELVAWADHAAGIDDSAGAVLRPHRASYHLLRGV